MNPAEIKNAMLAHLHESMNKDSGSISASDSLKEAGIDSFKTIELILFLENRYGIHLPEDAYTSDNLRSVESIVNCALEYHNRNTGEEIVSS